MMVKAEDSQEDLSFSVSTFLFKAQPVTAASALQCLHTDTASSHGPYKCLPSHPLCKTMDLENQKLNVG